MIIPSIDIMDGRAVQLVRGERLEIDAGDPRPLAERFAVAGEIAVIDLDAALGRGDNRDVIRELLEIAPCRVGGGIRSAESALDWLDAGARRVILGTAATPDVLRALPRDRVIAALDARHGEVVVEGWTRGTGVGVAKRVAELGEMVGGYLVTFVEVEGTMGGLPLERAAELVKLAGAARMTFAGGVRSAAEIGRLDALGADAQVGMAIYSGALTLADAIAAPLVSDRPDGLWPTIVEDTAGRVLGLAWSNPESLQTALDEGRGVYHSRRRGLWRKGESSGALQKLVRVSVDCDRDVLLFTVDQLGSGFCHTGEPTCFDRPGAARRRFSMFDLEARIRTRLGQGGADPSLTVRLRDDPELLAGKLLEEAGELAEAATASEAAAEFADLLYFALNALVRAGGSLRDVEGVLERRSLEVRRRPPRVPHAARPEAVAAAGNDRLLPLRAPAEAAAILGTAVTDPGTSRTVERIIADVRSRGTTALREYGIRFGEIGPDEPIAFTREDLGEVLGALPARDRELLERVAGRVRTFAREQLQSVADVDVAVPGGRAGHRIVPVRAAGCYAPGGRFPLPSSVLMTAIPARVAGVDSVWVASPKPTAHTLAAAAIAGADGLLAIGGAHAVAALALGIGGPPPSDMVVGPGNRFVTAAKRSLFGEVGIDMLAGPSELLVVASGDFDVESIASDLLAQAEHDPDAVPLACVDTGVAADAIRDAVALQLAGLPTRDTARRALMRGGIFVAAEPREAVRLVEAIRPEHLHLVGEAVDLADAVRSYGAMFIGSESAEAFGDYGAGPNHTLPTGGTAAFSDGLSVFTFLRRPTWLRLAADEAGYEALAEDTAALARIEELEGHARSADRRLIRDAC